MISDIHQQEQSISSKPKSWSNIVQQPPPISTPSSHNIGNAKTPSKHVKANPEISESNIVDAQKSNTKNSNTKSKSEEQFIVKKVKKKDPIQFDIFQAIQVIIYISLK